jgi:hypothetical protein
METFKLVSKITAKHLFARLKGGKSESVPKAAPAKPAATAAKVAVKPAPAPLPEPEPVAPMNPFADSVPSGGGTGDPFPQADDGYEKAEEVSLEQLLAEGRERPATFAGNIAVPIDEVEELGADELLAVPEEPAVAVAVLDEPAPAAHAGNGRVAELEAEVSRLHALVTRVRAEQREALEDLLRELGELTDKVRARLDGRAG